MTHRKAQVGLGYDGADSTMEWYARICAPSLKSPHSSPSAFLRTPLEPRPTDLL